MVVISKLPIAEFGPADYREDAPLFSYVTEITSVFRNVTDVRIGFMDGSLAYRKNVGWPKFLDVIHFLKFMPKKFLRIMIQFLILKDSKKFWIWKNFWRNQQIQYSMRSRHRLLWIQSKIWLVVRLIFWPIVSRTINLKLVSLTFQKWIQQAWLIPKNHYYFLTRIFQEIVTKLFLNCYSKICYQTHYPKYSSLMLSESCPMLSVTLAQNRWVTFSVTIVGNILAPKSESRNCSPNNFKNVTQNFTQNVIENISHS